MPYITPADRESLEPNPALSANSPGELNFQITSLVDEYLLGHCTYATINEVIGVLECAKLEAYRRIAAPYEDRKIAENGDVYLTDPVPMAPPVVIPGEVP